MKREEIEATFMPRIENIAEQYRSTKSEQEGKWADRVLLAKKEILNANYSREELIDLLASDRTAVAMFSERIGHVLEIGLTGADYGAAVLAEKVRAAKKSADDRHKKPGGAREKRDTIRAIWATGKYDTHVSCAEQESEALGISYGTAIKHLRNAPPPT